MIVEAVYGIVDQVKISEILLKPSSDHISDIDSKSAGAVFFKFDSLLLFPELRKRVCVMGEHDDDMFISVTGFAQDY